MYQIHKLAHIFRRGRNDL